MTAESTSARPEHLDRPHLRRILPQPVKNGDRQGLALRDPLMLCPNTMVIPPGMAQALQHFNGQWTVAEIARQLKADEPSVMTLVEKLDELGLLWGPTAEALEQAKRDQLHADGLVPMRQSRTLGDSPESCRTQLDQWMERGEDPELEFPVRGLFSPRMDFQSMWPIYSALFHATAGGSYDRVLMLGNNQFGLGDGVIGTRLGFQSPLGTVAPDEVFIDALATSLGDQYLRDELDHVTDHGIEMQLPWLQHTLGEFKIVGALMPDPLTPPVEGEPRVEVEDFVTAVHAAMTACPGSTLVVATGDLSHAGPQFGEPRPVDDQRRFDVERVDREMLGTLTEGDADAFVAAVKWNNNPGRWSGLGAMDAMLRIVQPDDIELIDYRQQVMGDNGEALITCAGLALG